ncbi:SusC/RagA family TonB-linked outer membrane protein [Sphingobacterium oryzagri]|uniref:SusC/RagA family TonB-linked outer membrane protein n=1 Tax=Sphingobacterium oryzagri TaxID=3025669 RepID=A0ABY7WN35_9SPHI|nr:SusC/RagA family TonB-linked outer membrane protein [Sphingobacterium sp. KACC 22765]WDF69823.1 SusC/RagA family TonB-linked outer membrane protein [Sphingobacterium sp. KACC 22765]
MKHSIYAIPLLLFGPIPLLSSFSTTETSKPTQQKVNAPFTNQLKETFHTHQFWSASPVSLDTLNTIKGSIKDEQGAALQGVIVTVKGESVNVVSDEQGLYTLEAKPDATLIFNKTDFARHEEVVNNRSEIHVVLKIAPADSAQTDSLQTATAKIDSTQTDSTLVKTAVDSTKTATGTMVNALGDSTKAVTSINTQTTTDSTTTAQNAQDMVQGTVKDANGPLVGATVTVKGTAVTAATDDQGKFSIAAGANTALVFSAVGYKEHEEILNNRKSVAVTLTQETKTIQSVEVVAVGYGTMERATLASSVSSIGSDQIENEVLPSIPQAIQGKAGGVQVTQKSGSPGGGLNIRVRGTTSINASSDPLYVIDGIPVNSTTNFTGGSTFDFGGGTQGINVLSSLNPSDVQSVEILKDAASSSIYGSRAANGVVLITTKKGDAGTSQFHFNMYEGYSEMPSERKYDLMNTAQYQDYMRDYYAILGQTNPNATIPAQILSNSNINTDWQDAVFRKAATRSYELAASGGSDKTQYYTSLGYMRQGGILHNSDFNRFSGRINLNHQHSEKLNFATAINITRAENDRVQEENSREGATKNGIFAPPNLSVYDDLGNYVYDQVSLTRENALAILNLPVNNAQTWRLLANASAEYKFIPSLALKTSFGVDVSFIDETFFMPPQGLRSFVSQAGIGARRNTRDQLWINETTLTYDKTFGDHHINALAGASVQESRLEFVHAQRTNFPSNDIPYISAGGVITGANSLPEEWAIASGFARVNYDFKKKYIITANLRSDGSSRFGAENRWATFPSFAGAWRISEEDFMKSVPVINNLKLRGSWGITGNQNIGNYASYSLYSSGNNYLGSPGFVPTVLGDVNLKWETTTQTDIGIDVGLFNNRISILADYYHKKTSDLLIAVPIVSSSGYQSQFTNSGDIENKGFEFELTTQNFVGEFKWTTALNMTFNRNRVLSLPNGNRILGGVGELNIAQEGLPLGSFYGWKMIGVNPQTGMIDYESQDGPTAPSDPNDRQIIGDPNPDFFGGITNTFQYKNFDLSIMGQFSYGNDIFNYNLATGLGGSNISSNGLVNWVDRWRQPGDVTDIPRPTPSNFDNSAISDRFIEDGSFFRLRNITFGYSLPKDLTDRMKVSKLRAYVTVQNAFVFTNYSGYDPEVGSSHGGANTGLIYGYDYGSYPQPRIFTAGINLSF